MVFDLIKQNKHWWASYMTMKHMLMFFLSGKGTGTWVPQLVRVFGFLGLRTNSQWEFLQHFVSNVNYWKSYLPFEKFDIEYFLHGQMTLVLNSGFTNKPPWVPQSELLTLIFSNFGFFSVSVYESKSIHCTKTYNTSFESSFHKL